MCSLNFVAIIRRRGTEIVQFYREEISTGPEGFQEKYSIEIWEFENFPNKKWKTEEVLYKGHFENKLFIIKPNVLSVDTTIVLI